MVYDMNWGRGSGDLAALALLLGGCGSPGPAAPVSDADRSLDARMAELAEEIAPSVAADVVRAVTFVDDQGCERPRWGGGHGYFVAGPEHEGEVGGLGYHVWDLARLGAPDPDEAQPNMVAYTLDDEGRFIPSGAGWKAAGSDAPPDFLDLSPDEAAVAWNGPGPSFLFAWLWEPSPDNVLGWFGIVNHGMSVPAWYMEARHGVLQGMAMATQRFEAELLGYPEYPGACVTGADGDVGYPLTRADLVGVLDPQWPDTLLLDAAGKFLGVQWTWPSDGGPPPTLFGFPLHGPDAYGDYTLRVWLGTRFNPRGAIHPSLPGFSCDEPAVAASCGEGS